MAQEVKLSERLIRKLDEICDDEGFVKAIMMHLKTETDVQTLLEIAEAGGEEATPRNLMYAAINMYDERENTI